IEYFNRITNGKTYREYARQLIRKKYLQKVLLSIKNSFKYKKFVKKLKEKSENFRKRILEIKKPGFLIRMEIRLLLQVR
ncbi:MAG: hypothetical protein II032_00165, partial [Treponema sp.]|nr:hypothetical protein [Treponema sp.]